MKFVTKILLLLFAAMLFGSICCTYFSKAGVSRCAERLITVLLSRKPS